MVHDKALLVVAYHYFSEGPSADRLVVSAKDFAEQMQFLQRRMTPIPLGEALQRLGTGRPLPVRAVAITVDDVGEDFLRYAWPVVRDRGLPVALAVCPGFADAGQQWARIFGLAHFLIRSEGDAARQFRRTLGVADLAYPRCYEVLQRMDGEKLAQAVELACPGGAPAPIRLPALGFDDLRALQAQGLVHILSHSMTHPAFERIPLPWARWEVVASARAIRAAFGCCEGFVFPGGAKPSLPDGGRALLEEAGYRYALLARPGWVRARSDPFGLPRVAVVGAQDLALSRLYLSGVPACLSWWYRRGYAARRSSPAQRAAATPGELT